MWVCVVCVCIKIFHHDYYVKFNTIITVLSIFTHCKVIFDDQHCHNTITKSVIFVSKPYDNHGIDNNIVNDIKNFMV